MSIIMLSKDGGKYVRETVDSVLSQTYPNWEIIFMDDSSKDDTVRQMMDLMEKNRVKKADGTYENRIKVLRSVESRGSAISLNSSLKEARGRWIAFLNVGNLWEPTKLEKQIAFMENNNISFSYSKYRMINEQSDDMGIVIGGLEHINYHEMRKCCWASILTVMYDANKIGKMRVRNLDEENEYALLLNISDKSDCFLLDDCLAMQRSYKHLLSPLHLIEKIRWRYKVFHIEEDKAPIVAAYMATRNLYGGLIKKIKYVERNKYAR